MENNKLNDYEKDENGYFKMINGKKIYQIEEKTENDKRINEAIDEWREHGKGLSPMQYLHSKCK